MQGIFTQCCVSINRILKLSIPMQTYNDIKGRWSMQGGAFTLCIHHVQSDPFASPSRVSVEVHPDSPPLTLQKVSFLHSATLRIPTPYPLTLSQKILGPPTLSRENLQAWQSKLISANLYARIGRAIKLAAQNRTAMTITTPTVNCEVQGNAGTVFQETSGACHTQAPLFATIATTVYWTSLELKLNCTH